MIAAGGIMDGAGVAAGAGRRRRAGHGFRSLPRIRRRGLRRYPLSQDPARAAVVTSRHLRPAGARPRQPLTALGEAAGCPPLPDYPIAYGRRRCTRRPRRAAGRFRRPVRPSTFRLSRGLPAAELMRQLRDELAAA